jgi:hypothetical protein
MELLLEVAIMKSVPLLVTAKQQIASVRAEGMEMSTGNTGRLQNMERLFKV